MKTTRTTAFLVVVDSVFPMEYFASCALKTYQREKPITLHASRIEAYTQYHTRHPPIGRVGTHGLCVHMPRSGNSPVARPHSPNAHLRRWRDGCALWARQDAQPVHPYTTNDAALATAKREKPITPHAARRPHTPVGWITTPRRARNTCLPFEDVKDTCLPLPLSRRRRDIPNERTLDVSGTPARSQHHGCTYAAPWLHPTAAMVQPWCSHGAGMVLASPLGAVAVPMGLMVYVRPKRREVDVGDEWRS